MSAGPLGGDSFQWPEAGEPIGDHLDRQDARPTPGIVRPSEAIPRGLDGGRPSALGIDRRTPEQREADVLAHRDRIDAARRLGLMETEEALDNPSDLDTTWKQ